MNNKGTRVIDLFEGASLHGIGDTVQQHIHDSVAQDSAQAMVWGAVKSEAAECLEKALNLDVFEVFGRVWAKARELKEYADVKKYPPDQTVIVHLGKHDLVAKEKPVLDVMIGGVQLPVLEFALNLTAHFEAVALTVRGGRIYTITPGDCSAKAELKYGDAKLASNETPKLHVPGQISLGDGIAIA
jgi:hypothetical protein